MRKQNADHHSNKFVNKTIGKDFGNHLAECAGVNQDKSAEFIFNKFEANIEEKYSKLSSRCRESKKI